MLIGFVHLTLCVMLMFVDSMLGIYELIDVAILFCALAQMNYCCLIIYILNISINFFRYFNQLGLLIQTGEFSDTFIDTGKTSDTYAMVVIIGLCIYYVAADVVCFYAYREFKGMMFDHGQGGGFGMLGGQGGQNN